MYKLTISLEGSNATATFMCGRLAEAEGVKRKLLKRILIPIKIEITKVNKA